MYKLMELPYPYNDLEPDIDREIVIIHHDKHHKSYVDKLNDFLNKSGYNYKYSLEELPSHIDELPLIYRGDILYNVGGVLNHNLYWLSMKGVRSEPKGKLLSKINEQYGDFFRFKNLFIEKSKKLVGSGYTFLVTNKYGELNIINMSNQETPFYYDLIPIFTIDLWEHAYYLQYKNERNKYIENFWNKANFDYATKKYEEIVN